MKLLTANKKRKINRQKLRDLPSQFHDIISLEDVNFPNLDDV